MSGRVAVLPTPGSTLFETGIPGEVLGFDWDGRRLYDVQVHARAGAMAFDGGVTVTAAGTLEEAADADTLIVPGTSNRTGPYDPTLLATLQRAFAAGHRIVSICTGAFVLGAAGLLDGRSATTHWRHCTELRRMYPQVLVLPNQLYVDDTVITGAGCSAGIDVCLHLVKEDHGATAATTVARNLVVSTHRLGGQSQFAGSDPLSAEAHWVSELESWVHSHREQLLTVDDLARTARMSRRTLTRRFDRELGTSPARWLCEVRIHQARELLETTEIPIDIVSFRCGFAAPATFRAAFRRTLGVSPGQYRRAWTKEPTY